MNTKKGIVRTCLIVIAVSAVGVALVAETRVQPPPRETLVGTWVGYDQDRLVFARLELDKNGKGYFATTFVTNAARLYLVEEWSLTDFSLTVPVVAVDAEAESIYLRGVAEHPQLTLEIGGTAANWRRSMVLFNEHEFNSRNARVKERVESHKKTAKQKQ